MAEQSVLLLIFFRLYAVHDRELADGYCLLCLEMSFHFCVFNECRFLLCIVKVPMIESVDEGAKEPRPNAFQQVLKRRHDSY